MGKKILIGALALAALLGLGFAFGGFFGRPFVDSLPDGVREQFADALKDKDYETMQEIREQYGPMRNGTMNGTWQHGPPLNETVGQEVLDLREQIHDAMVAGDFETAQGLREQMRDLLPERPFGVGGRRGMGGFGPRPDRGPGGCPCMQGGAE